MKQSPAAQFKDNDLIAADRTSPQLGDCVRSVRQRLDLTLTEVHERTGIAISTVLTKQHFVVDTIAGLLRGGVVCWMRVPKSASVSR